MRCCHPSFIRGKAAGQAQVRRGAAAGAEVDGNGEKRYEAEVGTEVSGDTETDKAAVEVTVMKPLRRWIRFAEVMHGI